MVSSYLKELKFNYKIIQTLSFIIDIKSDRRIGCYLSSLSTGKRKKTIMCLLGLEHMGIKFTCKGNKIVFFLCVRHRLLVRNFRPILYENLSKFLSEVRKINGAEHLPKNPKLNPAFDQHRCQGMELRNAYT